MQCLAKRWNRDLEHCCRETERGGEGEGAIEGSLKNRVQREQYDATLRSVFGFTVANDKAMQRHRIAGVERRQIPRVERIDNFLLARSIAICMRTETLQFDGGKNDTISGKSERLGSHGTTISHHRLRILTATVASNERLAEG